MHIGKPAHSGDTDSPLPAPLLAPKSLAPFSWNSDWAWWIRYLVALSIFGVALAIRLAILPAEEGLGFLTFYPATIFAALICGAGPGILVMTLGGITAHYAFMPPFGSFKIPVPLDQLLAELPYLLSGVVICLIVHKLRRNSDALRRSHAIGTAEMEERKRGEQALAESEAKLRGLFDLSPIGIALNDKDGRFIEFNESFRAITGYTDEELHQLDYWHLTPKSYEVDELRQLASLHGTGKYGPYEKEYVRKDGSRVDVRLNGILVHDRHGEDRIWSLVEDVTELKHSETALYRYANAVKHSGQPILITDSSNKIVELNPAFTALTGYGQDELCGLSPRVLASEHTSAETYRQLWSDLAESGVWQGELFNRTKDGRFFPVLALISAIRNEQGEVTNYIACYTDITDRMAAERRIDQLLHHDPLTSLYNRYSLEGRLQQALTLARRNRENLAVLFIDLDRFKLINDSIGHHAGDMLLLEVAGRLQECVRESDIVARLGGDEFVVVITGMSAVKNAAIVAEKIVSSLSQPYCLADGPVHSSSSIGISIFPADGEDSISLMKTADLALHHAKSQGRSSFKFFTPEMNASMTDALALDNDLRIAVAEKQFELHYQPKISVSDSRVAGVEALVRWRHPIRGLVPPVQFIPLAEESGLIEQIGDWVLDEACRQWSQWREIGMTPLSVAVNLSARQLASPTLVEKVAAVMRRYGLPRGALELEVTESVAMRHPESAIEQLKKLGALGIEISIDDFGTGYSSLAYLKLLPIQILKLDRAFVRDIETDENDAVISAATLALAHALGLKVVAEGIETEGQRDFLTSHGCDYLQGYLFSKPLTAVDLEEFIKARRLRGDTPTLQETH
jgi:diguanylate cyclase (GGDEF)-like protein/PAS domain S-box-containing protein